MSSQLFDGLFDDAAVFPPTNLPLRNALDQHAAHRSSRYSAMVGPLLLPAVWCTDGLPDSAPRPPRLGLVCRPGDDNDVIARGFDSVQALPERIEISGVEFGWTPAWRTAALTGVAHAIEVPRGPQQAVAIDELAQARADSFDVIAKFRTGPTATWPWPAEAELADFLVASIRRGLAFKLTGGLHHAVRGTYEVAGAAEENHGTLNVLLAVADALDGASATDIAPTLAERDADVLFERADALTAHAARRVRSSFTSYGCCTVTDPIGELVDLGLLMPDSFTPISKNDPQGVHNDVA